MTTGEDIRVAALTQDTEWQWFEAASEVCGLAGKYRLTPRLIWAIACFGIVVAGVDKAGDVVAVVTTSLWSSADTLLANRYLPSDGQVFSDGPGLLIDDAVVLPEVRGRKIGSAILTNVMRHAGPLGGQQGDRFNRFFAWSRVPSNDGPTSFNLLQRLGFEHIGTYPGGPDGFFSSDELFKCEACTPRGLDRCYCEARLMYRETPPTRPVPWEGGIVLE